MIDLAQKPEYLAWAARILCAHLDPKLCAWITVRNNFNILGVVVYTNITRHNCDMAVASSTPRFLSRRMLDVVFHYPFITLGLGRVSAIIDESNARSLSLCSRLGFVQEGTLRRWFGERSGIVMGLLRDDCKWIGVENEQKFSRISTRIA